MAITLGLDLGPSSVGWALVDPDAGKIINCGVRIFPEGVDNFDTKKEKPRNEARRIARGMRRQITRRARRRRRLREALVTSGLYPAEPDAQAELDARNPYELRALAIEKKLTPHEIGRIFIHLAQRRGFLSNRKRERKEKEVKGMLAEMSELQRDIEASNSQTLGQYLFQKTVEIDHSKRKENDHVRNRHTRREMLLDEFDQIWRKQAEHHPTLLTDALRYGTHGPQKQPCIPRHRQKGESLVSAFGIEGLIFFQRPLYWPRSVVGSCELEKKQKRCPRADRRAQRFRILQEVNILSYVNPDTNQEAKLDDVQRSALLDKLSRSRELDFDKIRKLLGLADSIHFNLETGKRKKLLGMVSDSLLAAKGAYGPSWHELAEDKKDAIVQLLALSTDDDETHEKLVRDYGLTPAQADAVLDVDLPSGYANLSVMALTKLLPFMEEGMLYMANDESDSAMHAAGYMRRDQLRRHIFESLPDPARAKDARIGDIPNPVVKRAIVELRKVVNTIIREYGKPAAVHVELTRQVRQGPKLRSEYNTRIREIEEEREHAADEIRKLKDKGHAVKVNRDSILRYILWKQQNHDCIYCGNKISQAQLFGGEIDVDHILPYGRSLDDGQMNKVVCHRDCNKGKSDQTPYEWLADKDPKKYDAVCRHALSLVKKGFPYKKYRRIIQKELKLDDFVARQLTATGYIASATLEYLKCLFQKDHAVLGLKGELTAELRHQWGLDDVLSSMPDSPAWQEEAKLRHGEKNRADHRHHAIDAIVVALTDGDRLHAMSRIVKSGGMDATGRSLKSPWRTFRDDVVKSVEKISVSHRAERKVAGALHEDTFYGKTKEQGIFVVRKPIESISPNEVSLIRDPLIRKIVEKRLEKSGIAVGRGKKNKDDKDSVQKWKAAIASLVAPSGTVIKRVRVLRKEQTIRLIREGRQDQVFVKPGATHHLALFEWMESSTRRREAVFVTMLEAINRVKTQQREFQRLVDEYCQKNGKPLAIHDKQYRLFQERAAASAPIIQTSPPANHPTIPKGAKFLFSLSRGELVLANWKGKETLLVFNTAASTQGQIYFTHHTDARKSSEQTKYVANANTLDAKKVIVDLVGRIRWAND